MSHDIKFSSNSKSFVSGSKVMVVYVYMSSITGSNRN